MHVFYTLRLAATLLAGCVSFSAYGVQTHELPLEEKAHAAELIVVGKVIAVHGLTDPQSANKAVIRVTKTLKGQVLSGVQLMFGGMAGLVNPVCCEQGKNYLFFLKRGQQGEYYSSNPPYGIYPMDR
jgi:hypothetical protein